MNTIVLTDSPEVVELKREFRKLDAREQELKPTCRAGRWSGIASSELIEVRQRKAEIARQIFSGERVNRTEIMAAFGVSETDLSVQVNKPGVH